jgi:hypothetical protein
LVSFAIDRIQVLARRHWINIDQRFAGTVGEIIAVDREFTVKGSVEPADQAVVPRCRLADRARPEIGTLFPADNEATRFVAASA